MPTITEENESELFAAPVETDFAQLLGLGDAGAGLGRDDFGFGVTSTAVDLPSGAALACDTHQHGA